MRRGARVEARGRVAIDGDGHGRGKIHDVSASGVRFRLAGPRAGYAVGQRLELELRFDGASGGWWKLSGAIVRIDRDGVAIAFDAVPPDFADWIGAERVATVEATDAGDVLVVDPIAARRTQLAACLRATGRSVGAVATPLDAITRLGESRYRPDLVAIADTVPASIANDLRAYLRAERPELVLLRTGTGAR